MSCVTPNLASHSSHETLIVVRALIWRRCLRYRRNARKPRYVLGALVAVGVVGAISAVVPQEAGSSGSALLGVLFFADLLAIPILTSGSFYVAAPSSDSQWVLSAPGGPDGYLVETMGIRLVVACLWTAAGLASAALLGHGRPLGAAAVLVVVVAFSWLADTSLGTLCFKFLARVRRPRATRLAAGGVAAGLLLAMGWNVAGLGQVDRAAGRLVEGRPDATGLLVLALLAIVASGALVVVLRSASGFVEPMSAAGRRLEGAIADAGKLRISASREGPSRLNGPAGAFLYVALVRMLRYRKRILTTAVFIGVAAVLLVDVLKLPPLLCYAPAVGLSLLFRLSPSHPSPLRLEWYARCPSSLRAVVVADQAYLGAEVMLQSTLSWLPVAFVWKDGAPGFLLLGVSGFLLLLLLEVSWNYASLVAGAKPLMAAVVRLGLPVVGALLGMVVWFASGHSTGIFDGCLAVCAAIATVAFLEASVQVAGAS